MIEIKITPTLYLPVIRMIKKCVIIHFESVYFYLETCMYFSSRNETCFILFRSNISVNFLIYITLLENWYLHVYSDY